MTSTPGSNLNLRVASYNCNSVRSSESTHVVQQLCATNDIICLQEHMLYRQDLAYLQRIHADFYGAGEPAGDLRNGPVLGRPRGGVAILWRKSLGHVVSLRSDLSTNRILVFNVRYLNYSIFFANVYMTYECEENFDDYLFHLGEILSIREDCNSA